MDYTKLCFAGSDQGLVKYCGIGCCHLPLSEVMEGSRNCFSHFHIFPPSQNRQGDCKWHVNIKIF